MSPFTPKDWKDANTFAGGGDQSTPLSAAALEDLETRLSDYSDSQGSGKVDKATPNTITADHTVTAAWSFTGGLEFPIGGVASAAYRIYATGDANDRATLSELGRMTLGAGGAAAQDTAYGRTSEPSVDSSIGWFGAWGRGLAVMSGLSDDVDDAEARLTYQGGSDTVPGAGIARIDRGDGDNYAEFTAYQFGNTIRTRGETYAQLFELFLGDDATGDTGPQFSVRHNGSNKGASIEARDQGDVLGLRLNMRNRARPKLEMEGNAVSDNCTFAIENQNAGGLIALSTKTGGVQTDQVTVNNDGTVTFAQNIRMRPGTADVVVGSVSGGAGLEVSGDPSCQLYRSAGAEMAFSGALKVVGGVAFNGQAVAARPDYTTSNVTTDRTFNANATTLDELADVVGTVVADLIAIGLFQ